MSCRDLFPHTTRRAAPWFICVARHARAARAGPEWAGVPAQNPAGRAMVHKCGAARPLGQACRAGLFWFPHSTRRAAPWFIYGGPARLAGPSVEISQIRSRGKVVTLRAIVAPSIF